ncbi:hypothetical protein Tco_1228769 [Tanacetum coccineum]
MEDANTIRTLGDYSKPSHEGYRNTIELHEGKNVEDLTTRFLAQFFPSGRTANSPTTLSEAWTRFKDLLQKVPYHGINLWLQVQIFYDHVNPVTRRTIDQSAGGKLCDRNAKKSLALLKDLALYDNESWNDPRDFAKPVKAIYLPQDVPSTSDRRLIELENQWSLRNSVLHGNPKQAFFEYASSHTDEAVEGLVSNFMASQDTRLSKFEANFKHQQSEMTNKIDRVLKAITNRMARALPSDTIKNPKLNTSPVSYICSYLTIDPQFSPYPSTSINAVKTCSKEASHS